MKIIKATEFDEDIREKISSIYVESNYNIDLKKYSKNKIKLTKAFSHLFLLEYFYVAIIEDEIVGFVACVNKNNDCYKNDKKEFIKYLGLFKGIFLDIIYNICSVKFQPKYPINISEKIGSIEYVTIHPDFRRKGIATSIIKHIIKLPEFEGFILEVDDNNINAMELYKKLNFKEVLREKQALSKIFKNKYVIYMVYLKNENEK